MFIFGLPLLCSCKQNRYVFVMCAWSFRDILVCLPTHQKLHLIALLLRVNVTTNSIPHWWTHPTNGIDILFCSKFFTWTFRQSIYGCKNDLNIFEDCFEEKQVKWIEFTIAIDHFFKWCFALPVEMNYQSWSNGSKTHILLTNLKTKTLIPLWSSAS